MPRIVPVRRILLVAAHAVHAAVVFDVQVAPVFRGVAIETGTQGMTGGRLMAAAAIIVALMVEQRFLPICRAVAVAALAVVRMAGGCFAGVAACAVSVIGVVENGRFPTTGIVAVTALAFVMISRSLGHVALLAIGVSEVIERDDTPITRVIVAVAARAGVVVFGHGRYMATFTLINAQMVKSAGFPGTHVGVAAYAIAR